MHSVPRYSRPDLAVQKSSEIPCYNALLPRNPLIHYISFVSPAIFPCIFPAWQGKYGSEIRRMVQRGNWATRILISEGQRMTDQLGGRDICRQPPGHARGLYA
jgi:hypothetical protein